MISHAAALFTVSFEECLDAAVIFAFPFRWEKASGQLTLVTMMGDAFTANPSSIASQIGAGTLRLVVFQFAFSFHKVFSSFNRIFSGWIFPGWHRLFQVVLK